MGQRLCFCVTSPPTPGPGSPPHARQNPLSIPETAALGLPGWPLGLSTAAPSGGWSRPGGQPALPRGLYSTHCLLSLHGPTVIRSRSPASCAPLLCTALPGCSNH